MIDLMHAFNLIFLIDKSTILKRNKLLLLLLLSLIAKYKQILPTQDDAIRTEMRLTSFIP